MVFLRPCLKFSDPYNYKKLIGKKQREILCFVRTNSKILNEEKLQYSYSKMNKNIKKVILLFRKFGRVFVVDDNSDDNTYMIKKFAHKIIRSNKNLGYDGAIRFGILNIINSNIKIDYLLTVDADGEHSNRYVKHCKKNE